MRLLQQGENWTLIWPENFVQRTEPLRRLDLHTHEYQLGEKRDAGVQKITARPACESNNYTHSRPAKKQTEWPSASLQNKKNELVRKFAMALPAISTKINANPLGLRKSNPIYCVPVYKISITWTREQPRSSDLQACCRKKEKRAQPELGQKAR
jgi:hypothetical protein